MDDRRPTPQVTVVTGAAGWLGRALVHRLLDDPAPSPRCGPTCCRPRMPRLLARHPRLDQGARGRPVGGRRRPATCWPAQATPWSTSCTPPASSTRARVRRLPSGQRRGHRRGRRRRGRARVFGGWCTCRRTARSAPTRTRPTVFRDDEPYHPYLGYGQSKMQAELAVFAAEACGARCHDRPTAVVLRAVPAAPADHVLPDGARRPVPGHRRRPPAAIDGVRRQPGRRHHGAPSSPRSPAAGATGSPTPGPTRWSRSSRPSDARSPTRASRVKPGAAAAAGHRRTGRRGGRPGHPARRSLPAAAPRAGRDGQDHRLRHLGQHRPSSATGPTVELYEGMRRSIRWCVDQGLEL